MTVRPGSMFMTRGLSAASRFLTSACVIESGGLRAPRPPYGAIRLAGSLR
jgi:hypothetical protein